MAARASPQDDIFSRFFSRLSITLNSCHNGVKSRHSEQLSWFDAAI